MTAPSVSTSASKYANVQSEFVAVVLAATVGTRLFPLTDVRGIPKHLLPVAGAPIFKRLLHQLHESGFEECVVAIAQEDHQTVDFIRQELKEQQIKDGWREIDPSLSAPTTIPSSSSGEAPDPGAGQPDFASASITLVLEIGGKLKVTIVRLGEECEGSVGAINQIEATGVIAPKSTIVVLPGDLVLVHDGTSATALVDLVHAHRQGQASAYPAACTVLLSDAGDQDENGIPLKESAKQKKGGLAREEDDVEYIALSYPSSQQGATPRIIWKQSKLEAEEDKDMTGATPKLALPKPRLRVGDITRVRSDWTDVHVYVLSPWVRRLIWVKNSSDEKQQQSQLSLISLVDDLLPLLITRQFLGIQETFGSKLEPAQVEELLKSLASTTDPMPSSSHLAPSSSPFGSSPQYDRSPSTAKASSRPYSVLAHVQTSALRSATVPAYLHASKELVALVLSGDNPSTYASALGVPPESFFRQKAQTVILPNSKIGDKVTFKSTVVGRNCTLGHKCRLNNVILLDNVTLGDNVSLQNTVVGKGAVLGDNCSLNDCQVAPGKKVPSGTKAKSEALTEDLLQEG